MTDPVSPKSNSDLEWIDLGDVSEKGPVVSSEQDSPGGFVSVSRQEATSPVGSPGNSPLVEVAYEDALPPEEHLVRLNVADTIGYNPGTVFPSPNFSVTPPSSIVGVSRSAPNSPVGKLIVGRLSREGSHSSLESVRVPSSVGSPPPVDMGRRDSLSSLTSEFSFVGRIIGNEDAGGDADVSDLSSSSSDPFGDASRVRRFSLSSESENDGVFQEAGNSSVKLPALPYRVVKLFQEVMNVFLSVWEKSQIEVSPSHSSCEKVLYACQKRKIDNFTLACDFVAFAIQSVFVTLGQAFPVFCDFV